VSVIVRSLPLAGVGEGLARVPSGQHVDRLHLGPVDDGQVAEVGDAGEPDLADLGGVLVDLGQPDGLGAEECVDGQVEAAVTGAEGAQ
jgi:hypothetical protein